MKRVANVGRNMINKGKKSVLGINVDVCDYADCVQRIINSAKDRKYFSVSALAVHGIMTGVKDPEHRYRLNKFSIIAPDGQPVRWALRFLYGERLKDRVYGPNLTLEVCKAAEGENIPVYFYGSTQNVLNELTKNLSEQFPQLVIAGAQPSKFRNLTEEEYSSLGMELNNSGAKIFFIGLGCPRQEVFVYEHMKLVNYPMLAVGAAFDFHAGCLKQAPTWMQKSGLEWFYRLLMEPRRLWRRYIFLNPEYIYLVLRQKLIGEPKTTKQNITSVRSKYFG